MAGGLGLYSAGIEMASKPNQIPTPDASSMIAFLRSCPALAGLPGVSIERLAAELVLVVHEAGKRFYADEVPSQKQPLRIIVHGQATWESSRAREQKGAWMLGPGSLLGVDVINDWAWHAQRGTPWPAHDLPTIRCQALAKIWTLELAPERFAAA
ncbi:MAG: hypothetical protein HC927_02775, partial [Deltaproteobacteria bacterium]|nr:hypothetical protein [Deltaproteobacteria bacterium]